MKVQRKNTNVHFSGKIKIKAPRKSIFSAKVKTFVNRSSFSGILKPHFLSLLQFRSLALSLSNTSSVNPYARAGSYRWSIASKFGFAEQDSTSTGAKLYLKFLYLQMVINKIR